MTYQVDNQKVQQWVLELVQVRALELNQVWAPTWALPGVGPSQSKLVQEWVQVWVQVRALELNQVWALGLNPVWAPEWVLAWVLELH